MEVAWRKCARAALRLLCRTRTKLVPLLMEQSDLYTQFSQRFKNMVENCQKSDNVYVQYLINHSCHVKGFIGKNIDCFESICTSDYMPELIAREGIVTELMNIRDGMHSIECFTLSEINDMLKFACTY